MTALRFLALGAAVLGAAYGISEAVDPVYPEMRAKVAFFQHQRSEVEAVTVGNSHSRAVDFRALGLRGMHFWQGGQDAFEAAYFARYAAAQAPRLRYVLFAASSGFERTDHAVPTLRDRTDIRREVYARTPHVRPIGSDLDLWVSGTVAPLVRADHWRGVVYRLNRPRRAVHLTDGGGGEIPPLPPHTLHSISRHARQRAALHDSIGTETLAVDPTTPSRVAAEMDALAGNLDARGVMLVLYTPPYHQSYLRERGPAVHAETQALLADVLRRNANAVWLDFSTDPRFVGRTELYADSDHMNFLGARLFSVALRQCLNALAVAPRPGSVAAGCPVSRAQGTSGIRAPARRSEGVLRVASP